jgi:murein DD-endopeptidase MepM/ murein hydrolase activator NlpD
MNGGSRGRGRATARWRAVALLGALALTAASNLVTAGLAGAADGPSSNQTEAERREHQKHQVDAALRLDPATATSQQIIAALTVLDQDRQSQLALGANAERAQQDAERRLAEHLAALAEVQPEFSAITNELKAQAIRMYLDPEETDRSIRLLKAGTFDDAQQRRVFDDVIAGTSTSELIERLHRVQPRRDELQAKAVAARDEAAARKKEHTDRFSAVLAAQDRQVKLQAEWEKRTTNLPKASDDVGDTSALDRAIAEQRAKLPAAAPAPRSSNGKMIWPAVGPITDRYGYLSSRGRNHWGIDLGISTGTPVVAALGGKVVTAGWNAGYGYLVAIDHAGGLQTRYAHNSKLIVTVGQTVTQGQQVSLSGSTGNSTGPHLHFEVYLNGAHVNPANYLP